MEHSAGEQAAVTIHRTKSPLSIPSLMALAQTIIRTISNVDNQLAARLSNRDARQLASALLPGDLRLKLVAAAPEGCNQGGGRGGVLNK